MSAITGGYGKMADSIFDNVYNPDVLSCLANLSSDEVFTPPSVANAMLDMLPQELFSNPDTKFLDPACKSGVFLREIAKRLIDGLEHQFPDLNERIDHIFRYQLYGIAITELTSLISRRSLYCSAYPNSEYSVVKFDNAEGNIRFRRINHTWRDGKCVFCGAAQSQYSRGDELETHAYEFIHFLKPEEIFNMKFDVIISNPPYQLNTGTATAQAVPLYHKFIMQIKKLNPKYISMIIPSRWYAGGMGLDSFREEMLNDGHISNIVDYPNAKDCFSGLSIGGGVCYFLWEKQYSGLCKFTNVFNGKSSTLMRKLNEFPVFVRYNQAITIIHKIYELGEKSVSEIVSSLNPFGFSSSERGKEKSASNDIALYSSKGWGYVKRTDVMQGLDLVDKYKVMISKTTGEHAGEADKEGKYRVLSRMCVLKPKEICTFSYFTVGNYDNKESADNLCGYLSTKFARFLLLQAVSSINLSKDKFCFVPMQDFSKPWTDEELYQKYNLTEEEIAFIESMIKPMDL